MKHFNKSEYTLGDDGFYRRTVRFSGMTEIIVRDDRGDLVRIERLKAGAKGGIQCETVTK